MQPRLQEKKVLSIDSGGNFRFFPELGATQQASNSVAPSTSHTHNQVIATNKKKNNTVIITFFFFQLILASSWNDSILNSWAETSSGFIAH